MADFLLGGGILTDFCLRILEGVCVATVALSFTYGADFRRICGLFSAVELSRFNVARCRLLLLTFRLPFLEYNLEISQHLVLQVRRAGPTSPAEISGYPPSLCRVDP